MTQARDVNDLQSMHSQISTPGLSRPAPARALSAKQRLVARAPFLRRALETPAQLGHHRQVGPWPSRAGIPAAQASTPPPELTASSGRTILHPPGVDAEKGEGFSPTDPLGPILEIVEKAIINLRRREDAFEPRDGLGIGRTRRGIRRPRPGHRLVDARIHHRTGPFFSALLTAEQDRSSGSRMMKISFMFGVHAS